MGMVSHGEKCSLPEMRQGLLGYCRIASGNHNRMSFL